MSQLLFCPQGHQWQTPQGPETHTSTGPGNLCPQCGAPGVASGAGAPADTCPNGHAVAVTDQACPVCDTVVTQDHTPLPPDSVWPPVPGYEILSVLGQGGMGVVY
jgi:hypothetical protein